MGKHVLQIAQPIQMHARLLLAGTQPLARLAPREPHRSPLDALRLRTLAHVADQLPQHPPRLWRQLVQRTPEHLVRQPVRQRDIRQGGLDVLEGLAAMSRRADRPLVLVQQRNGVDQRQVLLLIAPQPHAGRGERQLLGVRVHDREGFQQRLRCTMRGDDGFAARPGQQPLQRPRRPLPRLDRRRLFPRFIDRQHQTAVQ